MKKLYIAVTFILLSLFSYSQTMWQSAYGDTIADMGKVIIGTYDGGYCLVGSCGQDTPDSSDITIYRTDNFGQLNWSARIGMPGDETPTGVVEDVMGGFIIVGTTKVSQLDSTHSEIFVLNIDNSGSQVLWSKVFGGPLDDEANSIFPTPDGYFIISGSTMSFGSSTKSALALKINDTGDQQWCTVVSSLDNNYFNKCDLTTDQNYILGGGTFDSSNYDNLIAKIDTNGNVLWSERYGTSGANRINDIKTTSDSGFIAAGIASVNTAGDTDQNITKLDSLGGIVWSYNYGTAQYDISASVIETPSQKYIVCGYSLLDSISGNQKQMVLEELNQSGDIIWANTYGGNTNNSTGIDLINGTDDGYAATGTSDAFSDPIGDVFFVKTDTSGVSGCLEFPDTLIKNTASLNSIPGSISSSVFLDELFDTMNAVVYTLQYSQNCFEDNIKSISAENNLKLYPNPAQNSLQVESNLENPTATIVDGFGRIIYQRKLSSSKTTIDISTFASGIYFLEVGSTKGYLRSKFIKD